MDVDYDKILDSVLELEETEELQVGHIVKGTVAFNTKQFSFVKVGKLSCILPFSEISHDKKPKILKVGTKIEAVVVRISEENGVMLSIKRVKQDPWDMIDDLYHVGQRVSVKVKNVTNIGAFVELDKGFPGLIHRKELSYIKSNSPDNLISVDDVVEAEILIIDKEKRRIQLSRKRCLTDPWERVSDTYYVGQKLTRKVVNISNFGAFFEIEPGIDALLHRLQMGLSKSDKVKDFVSINDELEVEIFSIDIGNKRMSLSCDKLKKKE